MVLGGFKYCALCDSAGGKRFEAARHRAGAETQPKHDVERIHSIASGRAGRDRLLHGGGLELARPGNILRLVLHSSGEPPRQLGRDYAAPRPRMDATNGAQRDRRQLGIPRSAAVRIA
jgi:hypothetical protein